MRLADESRAIPFGPSIHAHNAGGGDYTCRADEHEAHEDFVHVNRESRVRRP